MTESFFQPAVMPSQRELICHHFHQHGRSTRAVPLDNTHRILRRILHCCSHNRTTADRDTNFSTCLQLLCSFLSRVLGPFLHVQLGPVPGCFSFLTSIGRVFHQTFCSPPGWGAGMCFIVASGEPSDTPWLTASLSALHPSPAAIGSLFRAPSTRFRMFLLHCEPSVLTSTAVFDVLLLIKSS